MNERIKRCQKHFRQRSGLSGPNKSQRVFILLLCQPTWIQQNMEGDYRYMVAARRAVVAEAVARMVTDISYWKLHNTFHADFGAQPGFLMWVNQSGFQVATVRQ